MSTNNELTAKQAKFVLEYLVDGNGTRAAVAAGYGVAGARVTACRTLANPNVKTAVEAGQARGARLLEIERMDVVKGLLEAFELAKFQCNPSAMVSAARELGKLLGFYAVETRRVEVSTCEGADQRQRLERMSDAELMAIMTP